jgi:phytol kinase
MLDWLKIGLVMGAIGGLMGGLAVYQRRYSPHPEWVRKLMHMGAGLVALSLPWLFTEPWPVLVLTALAATVMASVKWLAILRHNVGQVTGGVLRTTLGEICFPLGAGALYLLAGGDLLLYSIPLLILTFADASAALVGVFYGVRRYTTSEGTKTLEGSLAFFQAALLSTLAPLLLFSEVGRAETLLIALLMALLSMLLDAIAWWGLDNLLIPILTFVMLQTFMQLDAAILAIQLVVTVAMIAFVLIWRKRTTLNDSAVLATVVYGYLCWTLGGWEWVLPPLLLFLSYNILSPPDVGERARPYTVQVVLGVGAVGLFWLILAAVSESPQLYFPFMLSFAAQLAMIGLARWLRVQPGPVGLALASSVLVSWLLLFVPFAVIAGMEIYAHLGIGQWLGFYAVAGLACVTAGAAIFSVTQSGPDGYRNTTRRWLLQTLSAALASLLGFAAVQIG